MKAIQFKDRTVSLVDKPRPKLAQGDVLVKTTMAGICSTDMELLYGYYGFQGTPGHEFVGTVEESPMDRNLVGKRVVADINIGCGDCPICRRGSQNHCPDRRCIGIKNHDGAFAEYLSVPAANLLVVNDSVSDIEAVFAEPLAAALRIARQIHIKCDHRIAVIGDGKMGLIIALALRHYNPGLTLIGKHAARLSLASKMGVHTVELLPGDSPEVLPARTGLFDIVIEATGRPDGIGYALNLVKSMGTIFVKTTSRTPSNIDLASAVVREISIIGSRCGSLGDALIFLKNGWIDVKPLVEEVYEFKDFEQAFLSARKPGAGKVLVRFE